ncbi:hypothetical protein C8Q76DRAFT_744516 [Earliella scabrosa]|nr:hypothetical protein C8Q76DRAFT_744516 [Earliella scabrosa]
MQSPDIPEALLAGIKETLACVVIGGIVGTAIYGITVLQTYIYFRRYTNDTLGLKLLVATLFIYKYLVTYFLAPVDKFLVIFPTLGVENGVTVVIATMTQCFFGQRIWYFSKNKCLAWSIYALSIGALGPGMALTIHLFVDTSIFSIGSLQIRILAGFANGLSVICDVLIAAGLCYYLSSGKSGFTRTNNMVDRLMLYAIQRGALTAICQACHMITTVALPGRFLFLPFAFIQGKLYCNTLLATLNVRNSLKNSARQDDLLVPGSHLLASIPRSFDQRRTRRASQPYPLGSESVATLEFAVPTSKGQVRGSSP